jgi:protoporphyrinogen oxidase
MNKNIAIIGAGYTGLTAAYRLAQKGHNVTILDKGTVVGGLASEFTIEGASLERAYHHLFKTDTSIIGLADELGIGDKIGWHNSSVSLYYNNTLYPFKGALDLIRFKPLYFHNRIRAGLVVLYLQRTNSWEKLQRVSAYSWMRRYAGKQVTGVIWEPLLRGKFDTHFDKVAMAWLWARIHVRAQSREVGGEKLGYFEGGFQTFTDALVNKIESLGVKIKTGVDIQSINSIDGKVVIKVGGEKQIYDSCVATVPSHIFAKLVESDKAASTAYIKKLTDISYLGARLLIFSSDQELSPYYWHNINDMNVPFLVFINHTNLINKKNYNGKNIYYLAAYLPHDHTLFTCDDAALKRTWLSALKQIFPAFDQSKIHELHTFTFANAQHIVGLDYASKIPSKKTPLKNVYLSNFSQIFPEDRGTNYAVRDGEAIAKITI